MLGFYEFLHRQIVLADIFQQIGCQKQIVNVIGPQIPCNSGIQQDIVIACRFIAQNRSKGKEHFSNTGFCIGNLPETYRLIPLLNATDSCLQGYLGRFVV